MADREAGRTGAETGGSAGWRDPDPQESPSANRALNALMATAHSVSESTDSRMGPSGNQAHLGSR